MLCEIWKNEMTMTLVGFIGLQVSTNFMWIVHQLLLTLRDTALGPNSNLPKAVHYLPKISTKFLHEDIFRVMYYRIIFYCPLNTFPTRNDVNQAVLLLF